MDDQELENTKPEDQECWGSGFYETGATRPPKNYGGLLALLLTAGIILAGVINSVGMLRADRAEPNAHTDPDAPDIFSFVGDTTPAETQPAETTATGASQRVLLELHDTPEAVENIPQEGGCPSRRFMRRTSIPWSPSPVPCPAAPPAAPG